MTNLSNEKIVYKAVLDGIFEIDPAGRIWRVKNIDPAPSRWLREQRLVDCPRRRGEYKVGGYLRVKILLNGKSISTAAHRLVWIHFNGEIPDGMTINHKNGIKDDNRPENLELATLFDQQKHAHYVLGVGGGHTEFGENNANAKLTVEQAAEIYRRAHAGETQESLGKEFGCSHRVVGLIKNGKAWAKALRLRRERQTR